jgi:RluA family pseudouridine synthase
MKRIVRSRVPDEAVGTALDRYLAARFTYRSGAQWRQEIAQGTLRLNDVRVEPERLLAAGDEIVYDSGRSPEPAVPDNWRIIYEDPAMLIVDKPAGLPCHPSGAYFSHTLSEMLRSSHPEARIVNRLDRETSGLVVFGLSKAAAGALGRQFSERSVDKTYLALVHGRFPQELEADGFLERDSDCEVRKKRRFVSEPTSESAESARTAFRHLQDCGALSLIEARPYTGRLHQIRATLCSLGFPLVGDKIYGLDPTCFLRFIGGELTTADLAGLRLENQALHAWKLSLRSPHSGQKLSVMSPLRPAMRELIHS